MSPTRRPLASPQTGLRPGGRPVPATAWWIRLHARISHLARIRRRPLTPGDGLRLFTSPRHAGICRGSGRHVTPVNTYDPHTTLDAISRNTVAVVVIGGLSIVAMFVFFIEGARLGHRDRVYPMALWMTALWWPHDGSYLLRFTDWFGGDHSHWFMQLFWFA